MDIKSEQIEAIVKEVLANMNGSADKTVKTASVDVPKTSRALYHADWP